jgi:STE24 endopeptidase
MIAYMILQLIFSPIESQISQYMEKQADKTSIELTNLKNVFIDAQIRLARDNKSDLLPHPFRVFWLYSHPTSIDRIHLALDQ